MRMPATLLRSSVQRRHSIWSWWREGRRSGQRDGWARLLSRSGGATAELRAARSAACFRSAMHATVATRTLIRPSTDLGRGRPSGRTGPTGGGRRRWGDGWGRCGAAGLGVGRAGDLGVTEETRHAAVCEWSSGSPRQAGPGGGVLVVQPDAGWQRQARRLMQDPAPALESRFVMTCHSSPRSL